MRFNMNHLEWLQRGIEGMWSGEAPQGETGCAAQIVKPVTSHQALFCR